MHSNNQKGFTLIELLVVIVIISILTAIAIPTYLNYTARAQVVTGIASISAMQDAMVDYYQENGTAPANRLAIGYSESAGDGATKYVSGVEIVDGSIAIRYGNDATTALTGTGANIVSYAMYRNGDNVVSFLCTGGTVPTGLTLVGAAATVTNVPDQYLPGDCK